MNIGSKNKKRVVLPSRPELPNVDQILEDISKAAPDDPVFNILEKTGKEWSLLADSEVEHRFLQCRRYLELNERLREAQGQLQRQREELQAVGEQLDRKVEEIKGQLL
uniref:Chromosome 19 open reading frame 25 n=1 Tax=Nothobranchius korthausae TaxID=1143690 RepID=A0A1A8ETQ0_9TELE